MYPALVKSKIHIIRQKNGRTPSAKDTQQQEKIRSLRCFITSTLLKFRTKEKQISSNVEYIFSSW